MFLNNYALLLENFFFCAFIQLSYNFDFAFKILLVKPQNIIINYLVVTKAILFISSSTEAGNPFYFSRGNLKNFQITYFNEHKPL